jgi:PAS domain S-box-containing protein
VYFLFRIFGLDLDQVEPTFDEHIQQIHPDDRAHWQVTVEAALTAGTPYLIEFRILRPDGTIRTLEARGEVDLDVNGRVTRVFGTSQDISDRKQLESRLRSQLQKEQALSQVVQTIHRSLDLSVVFSAAVDVIGQFSQADRVKIVQYYPYRKLWCIVAEYRQTRELPSTLGKEIWDEDSPEIAQLKRFQVVHTNGSIWVNHPLGQLETTPGLQVAVPLQIRGQLWGALSLMRHQPPLPWQESETEFLLTVATQLAIAIQQSELHQQVQALNTHLEQQVEARTAELQNALYREMVLKRITDTMRNSLDEATILQTVVHQLGTALKVICCDAVLYNEDRTSLTISYDYTQGHPSAQGKTLDLSLYGAELDPLLQEQPLQFCLLQPIPNSPYPELYHSTMIACPIRDAEDVLGELWLFASADQVFDFRDVRLVEQVAGQCAIALRQSRLYQASQTYAKQLERLNQLKDDFLSTVTHELRAPMANIKMAALMLELMLTPLDRLAPKSTQYLEILKQECDRETGLINDLLDVSRLEAGRVQLGLVTLDLRLWLAQIIDPFVERTRNQGQEFYLHLGSHLPPFETDASYLQRIVTELLHNACKYTPSGERITLAVRWLASASGNLDAPSSKACLQISVTNTGVEIPEQERDRIFDKFYRIPNNDPWKYGGTGLGLALIKKLTECLGGTINLESSGGETTFTLRFFPVLAN